MDAVTILFGIAAVAGGVVAAWQLVLRARAKEELKAARAEGDRARQELASLSARLDDAMTRATALEREAEGLRERLRGQERVHEQALLGLREQMKVREDALAQREAELRQWVESQREQLRAAYADLSGQALRAVRDEFVKQAEQKFAAQQQAGAAEIEKRREAVEALVRPIAETLKKTDEKLGSIAEQWTGDKAALAERLRAITEGNDLLRAETSRLVRALREPQVRGRYGEVQLRRVADLAGMRGYCDFAEQEGTRDSEGRLLRPDMVVKLPNGRELAVDAKANLKPYLDALEASDPASADAAMEAFAHGVAEQASALAKKGYWRQYEGSPEFVVMFMPGDQFVDAALAKRPDLLELAWSQRVLLASPASLIALLFAVGVGWREERLAREAEELRALGAELHERARVAFEHVKGLGDALDRAVGKFNEFVGSYQRRLEPHLKRFEAAGLKGGRELPELGAVTMRARVEPPRALGEGDPQDDAP